MAPAITIYASPTADAFVQAASSPSSNSTSTASGTSKMSDTQLVLTSDLILLLVVVFLGLCALPRILVRFRGVGKQGWMIQHNTQAKAFSLERKTSTSSTIKKYGYEESDPYSIKAGLVRKYPSLTLLPHFPSYATLFHPVSSLFKYSSTSLHTRFTIGQFVVYIFYAFYILLNLFLGSSPVTNPQRAGWVAVSQLPVAVLLASKNNWVGMVVGKGYEKVGYLFEHSSMCVAN
jgi:ferric-chelate reductase